MHPLAVQPTARAAFRAFAKPQGFSLIEIMVVIAIIGTMLSLVGVAVFNQWEQAKVSAAAQQITTFRTSLNLYKVQVGKYPTGGEGLNALANPPKGKPIIEGGIPKDPWGNDYVYSSPGPNNQPYGIKSLGPNGTEGEDDIESWDLQKWLSN